MTDLLSPDLWSLLITVGTIFGTFLARKRIGRAIGRMIFDAAPEFLEEFLWEEKVQAIEGKKVKVKVLREAVSAQLEALAPAMVTPILKSIKINVPKDLPINPKTGQIDLLAPIAAKLMRGGKPTAFDFVAPFLPMAMQVGQVVGGKMQEFVGGLVGQKAATATKTAPAVIVDPDALIAEAVR